MNERIHNENGIVGVIELAFRSSYRQKGQANKPILCCPPDEKLCLVLVSKRQKESIFN